jgi:drug/metabolite transporter (DMT)-like permease
VLLIDLIAFPWFSVIGISLVATGSPDSFFGVLAVLAVVAFLVDMAVQSLAPHVQVLAINNSRALTRLVLIAAGVGCLAIKFLLQISHFSDLGWGFWLALALSVVLVTVSFQEFSRA